MVYQTPTINGLVETILSEIYHHHTPHRKTNRTEELLRKVDEYTSNFPARPASLLNGTTRELTTIGGDVVLVTGTTSGMGCDTLAHLLADESVARVYAFNRKLPNVAERQRTNFRERGLDEELLDSKKYRAVEGDASVPGWEIDPEMFEEVSAVLELSAADYLWCCVDPRFDHTYHPQR